MDEIFGKKANITPLAAFDAQQSNSVDAEDLAGDAQPTNRDLDETLALEWPPSDDKEDIQTQSAPITSTLVLIDQSIPTLDPSLPSFDCSLPGAEQLENLPNEEDVIPGSPLPSTSAQVRN